jgi:hypothetical protein
MGDIKKHFEIFQVKHGTSEARYLEKHSIQRHEFYFERMHLPDITRTCIYGFLNGNVPVCKALTLIALGLALLRLANRFIGAC